MVNRYLGGQRPAAGPVDRPGLAPTWTAIAEQAARHIEDCLLHEALASLWAFVSEANRFVDAEKPWDLNKAAQAGSAEAGEQLRQVLGDLGEACRVVALAVAPFMPGSASRILTQLGYAYPYGADGNDGPPLLDELAWGRHAAESGQFTAAEPLLPRLDVETAEP
jgi:methionyl-tRNA synthetase